MKLLAFSVLGVAAPQGSFKAVLHRSTGRPMVKQANERTLPWRQDVAAVADEVRRQSKDEWPTSGPVELRVTFFMPRPTSHYGKKGLRPSAPLFPAQKPDLSKLVRSAEDALTGIVYDDDKRIVSHRVRKVYADRNDAPHTEFIVETLQETAAVASS